VTDRSERRIAFVCLLTLAGAVIGLFAFHAFRTTGPGFPLDDAWIHQTYARNLGLRGEWAFQPGVPSAGSTSPLWTALLALGYLLGIDPYAWALAWGVLLLAATAWIGSLWVSARSPQLGRLAWVAGVLLVLEWHMVWAGASGMETIAQAFIVVLVMWSLERRWPPILIGLLVGAGVWIRPDALLLLLPVGWVLGSGGRREIPGAARRGMAVAIGLAILLLPYLGFNLALGGQAWPSTFYAKQAEYAAALSRPLAIRLLEQWGVGLVGAGTVLVLGFAASIWADVAGRRWARLAPAAWWFVFLAAYAVRLPVIYQHGRYAMPAIPILVLLGAEVMLTAAQRASKRLPRLLSRAWVAAALSVAIAFLGLGARAYGQDVAIIRTEMVAAAQWIADHTEPSDLIAAHDIGAVGYFSNRTLIDLAGLVSPEVIPFLRDETRLAEYLNAREADYLMTFPGWYPKLVAGRTPVFVSGAPYSPAAGGENMAVYPW
jgi:arabinofuranosyltransferase